MSPVKVHNQSSSKIKPRVKFADDMKGTNLKSDGKSNKKIENSDLACKRSSKFKPKKYSARHSISKSTYVAESSRPSIRIAKIKYDERN